MVLAWVLLSEVSWQHHYVVKWDSTLLRKHRLLLVDVEFSLQLRVFNEQLFESRKGQLTAVTVPSKPEVAHSVGLEEESSVVDDATREELLKHEVFARLSLSVDLYQAILQEKETRGVVTWLHDGFVLEAFDTLHQVDDVVQSVRLYLLEVRHLLNRFGDEALHLVLVSEDALLQTVLDLRELNQQVIVDILRDNRQSRVLVTDHSGCPTAAVNEANFTKVLSRSQGLLEVRVLLVVLNPDPALSRG